MSKTVTLRLSDDVYQLFRQSAENDNRPLSNFIETATKRFIEQSELADESEMAEIRGNAALESQHPPRAGRRTRPSEDGSLTDYRIFETDEFRRNVRKSGCAAEVVRGNQAQAVCLPATTLPTASRTQYQETARLPARNLAVSNRTIPNLLWH